MFGLRRIRQLQAEVAVLRGALDFYAINDNWRRRAKHVKGRQWELSAAAKDHGARAREALVKADAIRRKPLAKLIVQLRTWWRKGTALGAHGALKYRVFRRSKPCVVHVDVPAMRVTVPAPLPIREPNGATTVLP
jgi:hypothetical protein